MSTVDKCSVLSYNQSMEKGTRVRSKETGWTGVVTMAGMVIVQVLFSFENGSTKKSAWRVSDLEVLEG